MSVITSSRSPKQARPTDPAAVWDLSKRILFAIARKVKLAIRLKLDGHGRGEPEPEELVNDAFIALMEALPRFNPATAKFTTFVYGLARRRMWLVARAAFYGLSPEQMHRMDAAKRTPRYHYDVDSQRRRGFRQPEADTQGRCHPAAAAGEGCPLPRNVVAGRRKRLRRRPSPPSETQRYSVALHSAVPSHRGHGLTPHQPAGVSPSAGRSP